MDFQREVPADLVEDVQDRESAPGEVLEAGGPVSLIGGWEGTDAVSDTRTGKSRHGFHSKAGRGVGRVFDGLGGPLAYAILPPYSQISAAGWGGGAYRSDYRRLGRQGGY